MGREFHEHYDEDEIENYHPGCMGGKFNVLDYHHWYNVKKMFPYRKHNKGRRHVRCCANPQTISMEREPIETRGLLDGEGGGIQIQQQKGITGSTIKSSGKASVKGLSGKEKPKEEDHKNWISSIPGKPQLEQANSTHHHHHLEPSGSGFGLGWMNPIILIRKRAEASSNTSSTSSLPDISGKQVTTSKKPDRVITDSHMEHNKLDDKKGTRVDILEILKVNKDLFLDILQDPGNQTSKNIKLTKSGSFPVSDLPRPKYLKSTTLEHKQKEVWFSTKGDKSLAATQLSKSKALTLTSDDSFRSIITEGTASSSQGSDSQRWNHLVMNRLRDIKHRIRQALKERGKSISHKMVDGLTSRSKLSTNETHISESLENTAMEQDSINNFDIKASDQEGINNGRLNRIRRTKSITESLERYTQLFDYSVSEEANLHHSKSLKLSYEDKVQSKRRVPKFFRRISSLSDLESFCSLLHEVSREALSSSETPVRSILNYEANKESDAHNEREQKEISFAEDMDKFELVEAVLEAELQKRRIKENHHSSTSLLVDRHEESAKPCNFDEDKIEPATDIVSAVRPSTETEVTQSTSDIVDLSLTNITEQPILEGIGLNRPNREVEESFTFLTDRRTSHKSVANETMEISSRFLLFESDKEADPCYNYVRDILELSGFIQNEYLQTWYSLDQPLNPSLFKELETLLHPELECSSIDEIGTNCDHFLVFGLVNEALLEISEKSSIYFPKPFSFNSQICSMVKENNVLQKVWEVVSRNLASVPEFYQSLDDIIARDLAKDAWNWMNLQSESEFATIDLEDLIFDQLIDEVLCL